MKLVYKETGEEVKVGDKVKVGDVEVKIDYFAPPHKPASEGKLTVEYDSGAQMEFYVGVVGAEWIEREDRESEERPGLTVDEYNIIEGLRKRGFVVVIWTPAEIGEADSGTLEDVCIERGNDYLASAG